VTSGDRAEHRPVLRGWPELGGFDPPPPAIDEAREAFRRGTEAYAHGADAEACAQFLRAAEMLPDSDAGPYMASLEHLRALARANAEIVRGLSSES
jgi:hypothetical protein